MIIAEQYEISVEENAAFLRHDLRKLIEAYKVLRQGFVEMAEDRDYWRAEYRRVVKEQNNPPGGPPDRRFPSASAKRQENVIPIDEFRDVLHDLFRKTA